MPRNESEDKAVDMSENITTNYQMKYGWRDGIMWLRIEIATALRQAHDEAIEQAAKVVMEKQRPVIPDTRFMRRMRRFFCDEIRALKSEHDDHK